jgi:hypothetical protein
MVLDPHQRAQRAASVARQISSPPADASMELGGSNADASKGLGG